MKIFRRRRRSGPPCEVCGKVSRRNATLTSMHVITDEEALGGAIAGFDMSATFCTNHLPKGAHT